VTRITGTSLLQRVNEIWKKPMRVCATCRIRETDDPRGVCVVCSEKSHAASMQIRRQRIN
jgi:hypothetical protein